MEKKLPLISVIVPVYNTSKYLLKCLKSITDQNFDSLEIIIVNDCSTDDSLKIIEKIAEKDTRIIIINKSKNEGLELARKSGIKISKGKYICHVDSDDWLVPKTLKKMFLEATVCDADIVSANFYRILDGFGVIKQKSKISISHKLLIDKVDFINKYYKNFFGINLFPVSMCGKLYKRSFLENIEINMLGFNFAEDLNYNIQVFPKADKILFLPDYVYNYRYGGMTSNFDEGIMNSALKMFEIKKKYIEEYKLKHLNKFTIIELKNYLKSFIEMFLKFKKNNSDFLEKKIIELLKTEEYEVVIKFYKDSTEINEEFVKALIQKNTKKLIKLSQENVQKEKFKNALKSRIFKLLPN